MKAYDNLAPYYDEFMDFMEYDDEAKALHYLIEDVGAKLILDLGAGSGGHLLPLLRNGHKVDALDISAAMLEVLSGKLRGQGLKTRLFQGDMTSFAREDSYDLIYALGDTVHHLASYDDLEAYLGTCYRNLRQGGYLVFTYREPDYFTYLASLGSFYELHGDDYLLWRMSPVSASQAVIDYTAFIKEEDDRFIKIEEEHSLFIYEPERVKSIAASFGFVNRDDLADYLREEADKDEYKLVLVLSKP